MSKQDEIERLFDEFNKTSTEIDMALYILASSINELEVLRENLKTINVSGEIKMTLSKIENQLLLAEEKFTTNRMQPGKTIITRYLKLVNEIKNCL